MDLVKVEPKELIQQGQGYLNQLKQLVTHRPEKDKLVIGGRQYLYFYDWQMLGAFCGITAYVEETREITREKPSDDGKYTLLEPIGFYARAVAMRNGEKISAADAECMFDEPNWKSKPRFQVRSMAQTRACAKALRNCLSWIVKLPTSNFSDEIAEEVDGAPEQKLTEKF